jgi:hypothetical protein
MFSFSLLRVRIARNNRFRTPCGSHKSLPLLKEIYLKPTLPFQLSLFLEVLKRYIGRREGSRGKSIRDLILPIVEVYAHNGGIVFKIL